MNIEGEMPSMRGNVLSTPVYAVMSGLRSSEGILVLCKLASGIDAYVPLKDILAMLELDVAQRVHMAAPKEV